MKSKIILTTLAFFLCFVGTGISQNLTGQWAVTMDDDQEAGNFKGKEIGTIEFKKDGNKFYFVAKEIKNGYTAKCLKCPGNMKNKKVADGETRWGINFVWNAQKNAFVGGKVTEPITGKVRPVSLKVVDSKTMEMYGTYKGGARNGQKRTIKLTKRG